MSLSYIDYAERVRSAGLNVYFVAEGSKAGHTRSVSIVPANPTCNCYSVAKAFVVTAIGVLYDKGMLTPETKVYDVLADLFPQDADPRWREVTLHHVMLHRIGIDRDCIDIDNETGETYPKGTDYLRLILSANLPYEPGSFHKYNDAGYYLLSRVVERVSGKDPADLLRPILMKKMGFREFAWSVCPDGYCIGATGLYLRTEDMVKLGILYLRGGDWEGERIISEEWVRLVLENGYELKQKNGGWIGKGGMRGQMLAFNPQLERAVAWHAYASVPFEAIVRE
jgi:CubicO group peptidase (beta-lactamase class C family)